MLKVPFAHQRQVPLAGYTTLDLGGLAALLSSAHSDVDLIEQVSWAKRHKVPCLVLGGGSNVIVSDQGFDGLVVLVKAPGFSMSSEGRLELGPGEVWDHVVQRAVDLGWCGIECLSGIPGTVGATPIQNVGAYGQEISQVLQSVQVYDVNGGISRALSPQDCDFGYRSSLFKKDIGRFIVTGVCLQLSRKLGSIKYHQLREALGSLEYTLGNVRRCVIELRRSKSMVWDTSDPNHRSVGSFFTNPVVQRATAKTLEDLARKQGWIEASASIPSFPDGEAFKIPAAWLVEKCGFSKGYHYENVGISSNHALALINRGRGRTSELMALASSIQDTVFRITGIRLAMEPQYFGPFPSGVGMTSRQN